MILVHLNRRSRHFSVVKRVVVVAVTPSILLPIVVSRFSTKGSKVAFCTTFVAHSIFSWTARTRVSVISTVPALSWVTYDVV